MIEREFEICDMADDLLLLTLDMCDREGSRPRLPKRLHRSMADRIILTASAIQEAVILANETQLSPARAEYQAEAMRRCAVLKHQSRILVARGYISERQRDRWQKLAVGLYWHIHAWRNADAKRTKS